MNESRVSFTLLRSLKVKESHALAYGTLASLTTSSLKNSNFGFLLIKGSGPYKRKAKEQSNDGQFASVLRLVPRRVILSSQERGKIVVIQYEKASTNSKLNIYPPSRNNQGASPPESDWGHSCLQGFDLHSEDNQQQKKRFRGTSIASKKKSTFQFQLSFVI